MPQEDKIKREIDRIGLVLAKLLSMLLDKEYPYSEARVEITKQFQSELDIDLDTFLAMNKEDSLQYLVNDKKCSIENLWDFANLLYDLAHKTNDDQQRETLLRKAFHVYEYIHANNRGTVFLDVAYRIKELG